MTRVGYWDPFFDACDETGTVALHAHRVRLEDGRDQPVRPAGGRHRV